MTDMYSVSALSRWATALFFILIFAIAWLVIEVYRREFDAKRRKMASQCNSACDNWERIVEDRNKTIAKMQKQIDELNAQIERKDEVLRSVHMDDLI